MSMSTIKIRKNEVLGGFGLVHEYEHYQNKEDLRDRKGLDGS